MSATALSTRRVSTAIVPARDIGEATANLITQGWTRLEYPTLSRRFESLISSYIKLTSDANCAQYVIPDEREKDSDGENDLGLIIKKAGELKPHPRPDEAAEGRLRYDSTKFTHHYKPRLLAYLGQKPGAIDAHAEFFLQNARMYAEATLIMLEIAEELDRKLPGYGFTERTRATDHHHLLRLLRYLCDGPTPDIAIAHRDKNFISVHIRSDRGGLWLANSENRIIKDAEETRANSVLIFLGRDAWKITRGRLKGIIHGVKDQTFDDLTGRMPRHTAVAFGHMASTQEDNEWALNHMSDLTFKPHVKEWARAPL